MRSLKKNKGITLIETLVYVALFMLLIGAGMISAFYLIDSSERNKSDLSVTTESQFLLRKIDWALTGADSVSVSGVVLTTNKPGLVVEIDLSGNRARLRRNGGGWEYLTAERVLVENSVFTYVDEISPRPDSIEVSFTANGKEFEMIKYLRK